MLAEGEELETNLLQVTHRIPTISGTLDGGSGTHRKSHFIRFASALPDMASKYCNAANVRFSNRPFRVELTNAPQQTASLFVHLIGFTWLNWVLDKKGARVQHCPRP
jgi:hypothetical protein